MSGSDDPRATLTLASFSPHLGEVFRILHAPGESIETRLVEASSYGPGVDRDQFSLVFRGPPGIALPQSIYRVENDAIGTLELFLVPIGPDAEGMRYEAVFT